VKTIAFFNNKGGVGKTTLVYHLAWMFNEMGIDVVAMDLDPQANLTSAFFDESRQLDLWWPADNRSDSRQSWPGLPIISTCSLATWH
jgi:chromosome partitioning protein